jgi:hypothetical protein
MKTPKRAPTTPTSKMLKWCTEMLASGEQTITATEAAKFFRNCTAYAIRRLLINTPHLLPKPITTGSKLTLFDLSEWANFFESDDVMGEAELRKQLFEQPWLAQEYPELYDREHIRSPFQKVAYQLAIWHHKKVDTAAKIKRDKRAAGELARKPPSNRGKRRERSPLRTAAHRAARERAARMDADPEFIDWRMAREIREEKIAEVDLKLEEFWTKHRLGLTEENKTDPWYIKHLRLHTVLADREARLEKDRLNFILEMYQYQMTDFRTGMSRSEYTAYVAQFSEVIAHIAATADLTRLIEVLQHGCEELPRIPGGALEFDHSALGGPGQYPSIGVDPDFRDPDANPVPLDPLELETQARRQYATERWAERQRQRKQQRGRRSL